MDTYLCPKLEKRKSKVAFSRQAASDLAFMLLLILKIKKPDLDNQGFEPKKQKTTDKFKSFDQLIF